MSINFLPDRYSRVTQVTVAVPVAVPSRDALTDPSNGHVVLPEHVEFTLRRDEGTPRGDRTSAYVAVIGPRRLKSGAVGKPITTIGWEAARNEGPRGYVARPDWLTALLAENLPDGWDPALLELPNRQDAGSDELNPSTTDLYPVLSGVRLCGVCDHPRYNHTDADGACLRCSALKVPGARHDYRLKH